MKEVSVLRISDKFEGLVVTVKDGTSASLSPPEFEVFFAPVDYLQKYTANDELAKRVYDLEVNFASICLSTACVCTCHNFCTCVNFSKTATGHAVSHLYV